MQTSDSTGDEEYCYLKADGKDDSRSNLHLAIPQHEITSKTDRFVAVVTPVEILTSDDPDPHKPYETKVFKKAVLRIAAWEIRERKP